ncbi:MAG: hypothetical protein HQL54_11780 [Magnetococcales bacterium]|nr:hypothetical protein [Magnetococcales bacterium]
MTSKDIRSIGKIIYGPGLKDWVYVRLLARSLQIPENTINRWWHGHPDDSRPAAQMALGHLLQQFIASQPKENGATAVAK